MLERNTTLPHQATWSAMELSTPNYNSSDGDVEQNARSSPWATSLTVIALGLSAAVGLPSNVAVIIAIVRKIVNKSADFTLKLMLTLALCDVLSLLTVPPLIYVLLEGWSLGDLACKVFTYLVYWTLYASVLTVTSMSVQRVFRIKNANPRLTERLQARRNRVWLVALWVLAAVLALPVIPTRSVVENNGSLRCQRVVAHEWEKVAGLLYEVLFGYVIPFCVLVSSYTCLHKKATETNGRNRGRMTRLVVSIVVVFFVCWTPTHIVNIIDVVTTLTRTSDPEKYKQIKSMRRIVGDFGKALSFLNCCLDPFVYFANKSFLPRCLRRAREQRDNGAPQVTQESGV